ncbi:uncharacterized protein LOC134773901 [Penaeus indicus]|uniref:uncharacterized protein LOC134773901 n=1 Tax=Penaeus indicus TaxID=29960 RepID=UPI00300CEFD9
MEKEVNFRIQCGWNNWRKVSGVICDKRVPVRLKGKVHKAVVRPALIYSLEVAPLKKSEEKKMNAAEMNMLRWMVGVTRRDRIRNEYIRGAVKEVEPSKRIQESRLRCSESPVSSLFLTFDRQFSVSSLQSPVLRVRFQSPVIYW